MKKNPSVDRLKEIFSYDPETGILTRLIDRRGRQWGRPCGSRDSYGHLQAIVDGRLRMVHCVIWAMMTGEWPTIDVDHINLARDDNRWTNLRLATGSQNCANSRGKKTRILSSKGVTQVRSRFRATIMWNRKKIHIGYFDNEQSAHEAYERASRELHGEFARAA